MVGWSCCFGPRMKRLIVAGTHGKGQGERTRHTSWQWGSREKIQRPRFSKAPPPPESSRVGDQASTQALENQAGPSQAPRVEILMAPLLSGTPSYSPFGSSLNLRLLVSILLWKLGF